MVGRLARRGPSPPIESICNSLEELLSFWSRLILEAGEDKFIGNKWRKERLLEDSVLHERKNRVLMAKVVLIAKSQVEVIGHGMHDSGKLVIPTMVVEDKTINLALCRCLHDLSVVKTSPEREIIECEVSNNVNSSVKFDSKLFL